MAPSSRLLSGHPGQPGVFLVWAPDLRVALLVCVTDDLSFRTQGYPTDRHEPGAWPPDWLWALLP